MREETDLEEALFEEALRKESDAERAAFLAAACLGNPRLRERLEMMLEGHLLAPGFLATVPESVFAALAKLGSEMRLVEKPGDTIGHYRLIEPIGEGGCGVVYMAEQAEPVRRQVALKVIKLGMDTRQVIARFEAERQALALMDHPNIAKVFDAGATDAGRPFFVMELVCGVKITDYCDQHRLSIAERIGLFLQVCHAIQHAHQKGVIHRDIKPSNILVAEHDTVAVPKVIDFGIAKATTDQRLTDKTLFTAFEQFIGTPAYMSPEQAEMSALDIDTRTDIYSLGVLLYELLTGTTPFDAQELLQSGLDEIRRVIRETEPPKPSTRLSQRGYRGLRQPAAAFGPRPAATGDGASPGVRSEPKPFPGSRLPSDKSGSRLPQSKGFTIPSDLDWIVMKCLEKDRTRRYETANELAADLEHHLNDEPVTARPPSNLYRLRKLIRRNRLVFVAAALIASALMLGVIVSAWQAIRATRAEHEQSRLRERAEAQSYASEMNLAQQALAVNNLGRGLDLLGRNRPQPGQMDRRGWEWRYLWEQTRGDERFTFCQKPNPIFALAVSPDGKFLAVGERIRGHLSLWDIPSRREIKRLPEEDRSEVFSIRAAFSPTEPLLAYGLSSGLPPNEMMTRVRLWNLATQRHVAEFPLEYVCSGSAFSPDGASLVASSLHSLTLWDVRTRAKRKEYPVGSHQGLGIGVPFAVSRDFRWVAQAAGGGVARVFDLSEGRELWKANVSPAQVDAMALSHDGQVLATAGGGDEPSIRLWNTRDGRPIANFEEHPGGALQLLFGPDNQTLISATDQTIRVWDVSNPAAVPPPREWIGHPLEVWRLAFMPDGRTLISGGKDGSVRFWDLTRPPRHRGPVEIQGGPFVGWSFSDKEPGLLTCDRQGRIVHWQGEAWRTEKPLMDSGLDDVAFGAACFLPSRDAVVIGGNDGALRVLKWTEANAPRALPLFPPNDFLRPWCFRPHGNRLAVGRLDQQVVHDFDMDTWEAKGSWRAPGSLKALDFSPDGEHCAMVSFRGHVLVRNMTTGREFRFVDDLPNISSVAFSKSGNRLAISCEQGLVRLWETGSWRDVGEPLSGFLRNVNGLAFSPDGRRMAVGSSGNEAIRLYETERHQALIDLRAPGSGFSPAFDSSGNVLAALNAEGKLYVWRASSWAEIEAGEEARRVGD